MVHSHCATAACRAMQVATARYVHAVLSRLRIPSISFLHPAIPAIRCHAVRIMIGNQPQLEHSCTTAARGATRRPSLSTRRGPSRSHAEAQEARSRSHAEAQMPRERAYGKRGELLPRPPSLALLLRSMRCAVPKLGTLCAPWTHALKRLTRDLLEMAISSSARSVRPGPTP